ncbi:hypothetical protein PR048_001393 [Dryococelus australis]|uniref:Uncharacterized protein n=1 Tax=Dryococelus australis TaxID=614101 RepID=A0ABQ9IHC2_9NEOP|nr:hypothetical protein PR048_001393 [Dryococelus australis]
MILQWSVEDLSRNSSKLRRLPEAVLDQLDNHQPRRLPNGGNKVAKGVQKHTKRKYWKDTGTLRLVQFLL